MKLPPKHVIPIYKCIQRLAKKIDPKTGRPRGHSIAFLETLAKWFKRTVRCIQLWIKELIDCGWLKKQNEPGKKDLFLYPLLDTLPPLEAWSPTPKEPFLCPKISWVISPVTSPHTSYKGSYGASSPSGSNQVKQQKSRPVAKPAFDAAKAYASDPIKARAAADLLACGFWERGIPGLFSVVEAQTVIDACSIARFRRARGEDIGGDGPGEGLGGYVNKLAKHLKLGDWTPPKAWLRAVGRLPEETPKESPDSTKAGETALSSSSAQPAKEPSLPPGCPEWLRGRENIALDWERSTAKHLRSIGAPPDRWPNLAERARKRLDERRGPGYKHAVDSICQYMAKAYNFDLDAERKARETGEKGFAG